MLVHFEDNERCEKLRPNVDMMGGGVVIGPVIGIVGFAGAPLEHKLAVAFAVMQPVKSHVCGFGVFGLYFAIDDGVCHGVVSLDGGGRLFVSHFFQDDAAVYGFAHHDV